MSTVRNLPLIAQRSRLILVGVVLILLFGIKPGIPACILSSGVSWIPAGIIVVALARLRIHHLATRAGSSRSRPVTDPLDRPIAAESRSKEAGAARARHRRSRHLHRLAAIEHVELPLVHVLVSLIDLECVLGQLPGGAADHPDDRPADRRLAHPL